MNIKDLIGKRVRIKFRVPGESYEFKFSYNLDHYPEGIDITDIELVEYPIPPEPKDATNAAVGGLRFHAPNSHTAYWDGPYGRITWEELVQLARRHDLPIRIVRETVEEIL